MGHASRIWAVKFALPDAGVLTDAERRIWGSDSSSSSSSSRDLLTVYSFGEDATVQRWSLDYVAAVLSSKSHQSSLIHQKTYAFHSGKHLWSGSLLCCQESGGSGPATIYVLTGGSDGKITLIKDKKIAAAATHNSRCEETRSSVETTWDIYDIVTPDTLAQAQAQTQTHTKKRAKDMISRYDFLTSDTILAVSSMGRLCLGTFCGNDASWEEIHVQDERVADDLKNVYALRIVCHGSALLGSTTGGVYWFRRAEKRVVKVAQLAGRIVEMNGLSATHAGAVGDVEVLIHFHRNASSVYLMLDRVTGAVKHQEELSGLDERFVAISAARIDDLLAIGSRHGWMSLLRRDVADAAAVFRPILNLAPRSGDAVTAIVPLPRSTKADPSQKRAKYVLTTSRDGKYRIFALHVDEAAGASDGAGIDATSTGTAARMELIHETAPPFGPWIEGAWFTDDAVPELVLYGFRSKDFVLWNETRREELATMDCGGAHRTFRVACGGRSHEQVRTAARAGIVRFAFTRTSKLSVHWQRRVSHATIKNGAHGREIRSVNVARSGRFVATGAEDTSIRLWEYTGADGDGSVEVENSEEGEGGEGGEGGQGKMRCVAYLKKHVAGLQKVQWVGDDYLFSSGGREELFAWRVRSLDSAYASKIGVMCEGELRDKSAVEDLRIMDFDVCWDESGEGMLVTMAFSNSVLKTYRYKSCGATTDGGQFRLVCWGRYTGACLTQARHVGAQEGGGQMEAMTASTDGHIALWQQRRSEQEATWTWKVVQTVRVHQSSIKSLDMRRAWLGSDGHRRDGYEVLTGGDDNALGWTVLRQQAAGVGAGSEKGETVEGGDGGRLRAKVRRVVRRAHAGAITGVAFVGSSGGGGVVAISVSNDQWIKRWIVKEEEDDEDVGEEAVMRLVAEGYSGVADAGDVVRFGKGLVMLGGVGVEVWRC